MQKPHSVSVPGIILTAFIIAVIFKHSMLDLAIVSGESMSPTIKPHSIVLIWRSAYGLINPFSGSYIFRWASPLAGDIVLIAPVVSKPKSLIKRVFEIGPAYIAEAHGVISGSAGTALSMPHKGYDLFEVNRSIFIPQGRAFLLGDNNNKSFDSRYYGPVPIEDIRGKIILYQGLHIP